MNDDNLFTTLLVCATICVVALIIGLCMYFDHKNQLIEEAIVKGANPIAVGCAFDNLPSTSSICSVVVTK